METRCSCLIGECERQQAKAGGGGGGGGGIDYGILRSSCVDCDTNKCGHIDSHGASVIIFLFAQKDDVCHCLPERVGDTGGRGQRVDDQMKSPLQ